MANWWWSRSPPKTISSMEKAVLLFSGLFVSRFWWRGFSPVRQKKHAGSIAAAA
jgi:hypothetical protein